MPRNSNAASRKLRTFDDALFPEMSVHNDASILEEVKLDVLDIPELPSIDDGSYKIALEADESRYALEETNSRAIEELSSEIASSSSKRKRSIHDRPEGWKQIAEYYDLWGRSKTWLLYKDLFGDRTHRSVDQALKTWSKDLRENNAGFKGKRAPAYGFPIDLLLLKEVKERMEKKLPVDDVTLRTLLVNLLVIHERMDLMTGNGGSHLFLHGWAGRFWKRHKLPSRLISSKKPKVNDLELGELANDLITAELDEEKPVSVAAHLIALHNAPSLTSSSSSSTSSSSSSSSSSPSSSSFHPIIYDDMILLNERQAGVPIPLNDENESDSSDDDGLVA